MPLDQFSERIMFYAAKQFDSTATPGAYVHVIGDINHDLRMDSIQVVNTDTIGHNLAFDFINADGSGLSGIVLVPAGAGTAGAVATDVLAVLLPTANHYIWQTQTPYWGVAIMESVNAGKTVTVTEWGGAF